MLTQPRLPAAGALCAALLLQGAAAFQIWMSMNELPDELNRRADEWEEAKALVQGLLGPAAPHPTDPMPNRVSDGRVRAKFMQSFGDVPRILEQSWDDWAPTNGEGVFEKFEGLGFDADEVFIWGLDDDIGPDIRMTLSTGQLDTVASSPVVDEALVLVKSFGPELKYKDQLTPSIDHPACSGVVIEASSRFWCYDPDGPLQPHLAAAKYVEESGKRLFIMPPPRDHETTPLPQQMECMLDALFGALTPEFFCSDRLHIVAAAYGLGPITLLPERKSDGTIAASFTGGVLMMEEKRRELCSGVAGLVSDPVPEPVAEPVAEPVLVPEPVAEPVPEPVAEPVLVPEPVPEPVLVPEPVEETPEDGSGVVDAEAGADDDEDKGDVTHSSGLTASQIVSRIRKQRRQSMRGKVLVGTRTIRRGRRTRGMRRNLPVVADEVVAVDEDGEVSVENDTGGVRIHVSSSTGGDGGDQGGEGGSDGGSDGQKGGRSWAQCIKDCMDKCCKGMADCMKNCCAGMKKCCEDMAECMKKCCEGMKDMAMKCCEGMKDMAMKCCEGMKECMQKCCDGAKDCMKKGCDGVMKACKCMKQMMFTEEADAQEAI